MMQSLEELTAMELLRAAEVRRNTALVERDFGTLEALLDAGLVHTHSTGLTHDKHDYLAYVSGELRYLAIERGELSLCMRDGVAIMSGDLRYRLQPPGLIAPVNVHSQVLQVWLLVDSQWRMRAFQATRKAPALPARLG
jgi:hypothetical protein